MGLRIRDSIRVRGDSHDGMGDWDSSYSVGGKRGNLRVKGNSRGLSEISGSRRIKGDS